MKFDMDKAGQVLERSPHCLYALLHGLSEEWTSANEGEGTWNALDITAHLIYCDRFNWLLRAKRILINDTVPFQPFDRFGGSELSKDKSLHQLLETFLLTRKAVLQEIKEWRLRKEDYKTKGLHPKFGEVTLSQLFSAWVAHDLNHLSQVCRVMAKQYGAEVGPWIEFLRILK
jgi:hypothetical protein